MTSKIVRFSNYEMPGAVSYDLYDRGLPIMQEATLDEINTFLAGDLTFYQDLDPREYYKDSHPTDGSCWCGEVAVALVASVDPRDDTSFQMPRCVACLLGRDDVLVQ